MESKWGEESCEAEVELSRSKKSNDRAGENVLNHTIICSVPSSMYVSMW